MGLRRRMSSSSEERLPLLRYLYYARVPFTILSALAFVVMLAILESGRNTPQRVLFTIVAFLNAAIQVGWGIYLGYRVYKRATERKRGVGLTQAIDAFFALCIAWGFVAMAFWVLDTSVDRDHYWSFEHAHLINEHNNWVTAFDFIFDMTHIMVTSPGKFHPVSFWTRLLIFFIDVYHYLLTPLVLALIALRVYETFNEQAKHAEQQRPPQHAETYPLLPVPGVPVGPPTSPQVLISGMRLPAHLMLDE